MARSTYIYVVYSPIARQILAAFTVKHELLNWLWARPGNEGSVHILRFRDGQGYNEGVNITSDVFPL
ncbi:MAG: hypothetical protein V3V96_06620 [Acidiferrobacterales bacterium]